MGNKSISNATKDRLKEAVNDMVILVDEGLHPTSALTKVAKELDLTADQTRLVGRAFNTSVTSEVREKGASILEKLATVPIADCEEAVAKIIKTAEVNTIAAVYSEVPKQQSQKSCIKEAANITKVKIPVYKADKKKKSIANLLSDKEYLTKETKKLAAQANLKINRLEGILVVTKKYASTLKPEIVLATKIAAADKFKGLPDTVHEVLKVAKITPKLASTDELLLSKVIDIMALDSELKHNIEILKQASSCLTEIDKELRKNADVAKGPAPNFPKAEKMTFEKMLGLASTPLSIIAGDFNNMAEVGGEKQLGNELVSMPSRYYQYGIMTPAHKKRLEAIRVKSTVNDMLANDEIISQYEPDEVFTLYNELIKTAPEAMMRPMIARSFMREALAKGNILGSYDLNPLMTYEKDIAKQRNDEAKLLARKPIE